MLTALLLAMTMARPQATPTLLIRGGVVIDGTGQKRRRADVRVVGDTITAIGALQPRPSETVVDARGLVVAPGFIDTHSHADGGLLEDPDAETQIRQGITTSIVGQDGSSHLPLSDWFSTVEAKHVALNIASFVGQGTLHSEVLGKQANRKASPDELRRMEALMDREMRAGGLGLSTGLEYDPGFYSSTGEMIALSGVAARYKGLYISHVRDEGDRVFEAFRELITIARDAHLPGQISHIKLDTAPVWGRAPEVIRMMADARKRGIDITADVYPYRFWHSTIIVIIPTRNWADRAAWAKGLKEVGGPDNIRLSTYTPEPAWQGRTIGQISRSTGKDPITVIQEVVAKTHGPGATGREGVDVTAMTEPDLETFLKAPGIMFCTDGGLHMPHPRSAGSFPRILGRYVRERRVLTLEQSVHKGAGLPAARMGFPDRGLVRVGMKADLILFDPHTVRDTATVEHPASPPIGLPVVIVNGAIVLDHGRITGAHPGRVLRHTAPDAASRSASRRSLPPRLGRNAGVS